MNWEGFLPGFWEESAFQKLVNFMRGGNPFFSIKRVSSPHAPLFPKRTTKGLAALWTLAVSLVWLLGILALVTGLDVRHGCVSVPCLDYVTGLDVKHGFQLAVFRLCV